MKIEQRICERLKELSESPPPIRETQRQIASRSPLYKNRGGSEYTEYDVNDEQAAQWGMSCLNILEKAFGSESNHYVHFNDNYKNFPLHNDVRKAIGIMKAALDDYSRGFALDLKTAISGQYLRQLSRRRSRFRAVNTA